MIDFLNQVFEVSQILNLGNNDINRVLNRKGWILRTIFSIILILVVIIVVISVIIIGMNNTNIKDNTYATGTFYSTTKRKNVIEKYEAKYWLWKKIRTRLLQYRLI